MFLRGNFGIEVERTLNDLGMRVNESSKHLSLSDEVLSVKEQICNRKQFYCSNIKCSIKIYLSICTDVKDA